jgi:2-polyprenyl-3-methyl-5-hydroxy-6-metoxy-1,4-benzoquinol methylase
MRVLDFASGEGRHALAAARRGASVLAVDRDVGKLRAALERAESEQLSIEWNKVDLEGEWPAWGGGGFDAVLVFNYLDRARMPRILQLLAPGGILLMETFLTAQRELGWGPTADAHLLRTGELARLVTPLQVMFGREAIETVEGGRWRAVASIVARKQ